MNEDLRTGPHHIKLVPIGDQVEILEPVSLRDEFVNMTQSLHGIYHPA